ncbi:MAG: UTP--glucose-1-phosphate uridylyltransferase [Bacteroidota bacterium]|nr:UTP--glucose-1-phosphate uridylyltransferase [Bacteroidota bacterium]
MSEYPGDRLNSFRHFEEKMRAAEMHPLIITMFKRNYLQLLSGSTGTIARAQIDPIDEVTDAEQLEGYAAAGEEALAHTVVIKLNGGMGTSMGLEEAKSLIPVKDDLRFIDIIARQIRHMQTTYHDRLPLLLMNSFATHADSLAALAAYPELAGDLPPDFLQHRIPKVLAENLSPAVVEGDEELEWCPPGHGDIYTALVTSGLLERLLAEDIHYAFVSNADNLGAVVDLDILGYFATKRLPFMMEVADRTSADRKGGHLALLKDGRLTLRESAQCPDDETGEFQDITLYRYFNTNSLWLDLRALKDMLSRYDGILPLPLIRNRKTLDPRDAATPEVYQLETAMGAAISLFEKAAALRVPRSRFAPVKTTDDLLAVWSDAYVLTDDYRIVRNPARTLPHLDVVLDKKYYKFVSQLKERFPAGAPSLLHCASLRIEGDARFGSGVLCRGDVHIRVPEGEIRRIDNNTVLED